MVGFAVIALLAALRIRETFARNISAELFTRHP
jgi:hypothetical protein